MAQEKFKRKLTTIFSADVAGYSLLMQDDEAATVKTLEAYKKIISDLVKQHRGRVVDSPGDNLLAEFASVVEAVQCAVAGQKEMQTRNAELPECRKMQFRIGVNLGDVIEEESRIYGDGVNIAARLESLADPGGICISKTAFDQIETKLPFGYVYLGEQTVKNIAKPVGAYRVLLERRVTHERLVGAVLKRGRSGVGIYLTAALVMVAATVLWYWFEGPSAVPVERANPKQMSLPLPELPSIAVLPFANLSDDPKQDFLCDGLTEGIIAALSKVPKLFVVARDSTFTYKSKPTRAKQISEELGIRYVLTGSLQRSGDRIRISAQLIDALTGNQVWAERYDRKIADIFALQDDIIMKILEAAQVKLMGKDQASISATDRYFQGEQGLDCYLKFLEAVAYQERFTIEATNILRGMAENVLAMCPDNPMSYFLMAQVHMNDYWLGTSKSPQESLDTAMRLLQKSLSMDNSIGRVHGLLGQVYIMKRDYDAGIVEGERAVALDPGGVEVLCPYAMSLSMSGKYEEAIPLLQKAIRIDPLGSTMHRKHLGNVFLWTGRYEEAVLAYKNVLQRAPDDIYAHVQLVAAYSFMGLENEARAEVKEVLRINPKFSLEFYDKTTILKDRSIIFNIIGALRKAGLPERSNPLQS
jgi:adenylate cyclase